MLIDGGDETGLILSGVSNQTARNATDGTKGGVPPGS